MAHSPDDSELRVDQCEIREGVGKVANWAAGGRIEVLGVEPEAGCTRGAALSGSGLRAWSSSPIETSAATNHHEQNVNTSR